MWGSWRMLAIHCIRLTTYGCRWVLLSQHAVRWGRLMSITVCAHTSKFWCMLQCPLRTYAFPVCGRVRQRGQATGLHSLADHSKVFFPWKPFVSGFAFSWLPFSQLVEQVNVPQRVVHRKNITITGTHHFQSLLYVKLTR